MTLHSSEKCVFVAEDDTPQVVGFSSGGPSRETDGIYTGEVYGLYILLQNQHRGLGTRLFLHVANWLYRHDHKSMIVWVVGENPARKFYETLGGTPVRSKLVEIGKPIEGVSYGWPELARFVESYKDIVSLE